MVLHHTPFACLFLTSSAAGSFASVVWHDSESWNLGTHATLQSNYPTVADWTELVYP